MSALLAVDSLNCCLFALQVEAGPDRPLVLGFWSEQCTDHRSASAELGQVDAQSEHSFPDPDMDMFASIAAERVCMLELR
jgi:hypothetical protein